MDALLQPLWAVALDQTALAQTLRDLLAYLPIGLLLAVLILEVFAAGRRSRELDGGILLVLGIAGLLIVGGAVLAFTSGDAKTAKFGAAGILLAIICASSALVRQQWICQVAAEQMKPVGRRKRRSSGQAWAGLYGLLMVASLAGLVAYQAFVGKKPAVSLAATPAKVEVAQAPAKTKVTLTETKEEPKKSTPAVTPPPTPAPAEPAKTAIDTTPAKNEAVVPAPTPAKPAEPTPPPPVATASPVPASTANSAAFASYIVPIFRQSCVSCHGPEKQKGGLRLDTPDFIRQGGKSGPCITPGAPDKSHLYISVTLPDGDADLMPAEGKRLTAREADLISKWIKAGAPMGDGKTIAAASATQPASAGPVPIDAATLKTITDAHVLVRALPGKTKMVEVDCSQVRNYETKLDLALLAPVAQQIDTLDLSRTKVTDADLAHVAKMSNLATLQLNKTSVSDAALAHLVGLGKLQSLNLYGTQVTDAGLEQLANLKSLKKLYLWGSKATTAGAAKLKKALPGLTVSLGA